MDPAAEVAIRAGNAFSRPTIAASRRMRPATRQRVLERLLAWLTTPGHQDLFGRCLRMLLHAPFVLVPQVGGLEGIVCALYHEA